MNLIKILDYYEKIGLNCLHSPSCTSPFEKKTTLIHVIHSCHTVGLKFLDTIFSEPSVLQKANLIYVRFSNIFFG